MDRDQPSSTPPLPLLRSRRAAVVSEHARRLLADPAIDGETRVRLAGALRACEALRGGATTLPSISDRHILNASAREVAAVWARINGTPPWPERPVLLRWLDR